ncbi:helix-turn-helix transcriptional regulator [Streptomyces sp. ISL-100]|uniref:helix-turn-helix domain-containing protein n=1 Tax=Streptomyces sp. ISL-100 TaxID=2819173 RepID=UPI001BECEE79|nr:helix-turn-helix transcriptional regulator [Streptomyces sp. ISL-100]MBT2396444.1 helix-turn-helix transcriptional regulator [Streptomyces sp. ISL-100]
MTQPKHLDPYASPRTFYGAELRRLREEATWSQEQLGERVFCSGTYIGQFESATRRPQPDLSKQLDGVLGSGEHLQRLCTLARKSKHAEYFADAAELEKLAKTISEYSSMLVPGLLQTEAYARAQMQATEPYLSDAEIEERVGARMERAQLLNDPATPQLWEIIHEAALHMQVGGPDVMRKQLEHLAQVARTRRVVIQVLPNSAGPHIFMMGMVSLMTFTDAPPVAYVEGPYTGQLVDEPALVERHQASYDLARAAALSPAASLALIESAAEEHSTP